MKSTINLLVLIFGNNMRKVFIRLALVLIALPALAQTRDENATKCEGGDPNACTVLIQSGQEITTSLAVSYNNRSIAGNPSVNWTALHFTCASFF